MKDRQVLTPLQREKQLAAAAANNAAVTAGSATPAGGHRAVAVQVLPVRERAPDRVQQLQQQRQEVMLSAGEVGLIPKGPIVDSAASKAARCSKDVRHATNVRDLHPSIILQGSSGQTEVKQIADMTVGSVQIKDAMIVHTAPASVCPVADLVAE